MRRLTREWVKIAEVDFGGAADLAAGRVPRHHLVGFCCQQSAEKYLKALLEELPQPIPRTHDLDRLLALLRSRHPRLARLRRGLLFLSRFAVDTRYPGDDVSRRQAVAALRWASRVREACRAILGLPP